MLRFVLFGVVIFVAAPVSHPRLKSLAEETVVTHSELRELLIARRDTLNERLTLVKARFKQKMVQYDKVIEAHEPVLLAELELATTPEQRIQICRTRVQNFQYLYDRLTAEFRSGKTTADEQLQAKADHIQSQIDLVRQSSPQSRP